MPYKLPKDESVWVSYRNRKGDPVFLVTSKPSRDTYFLYEIVKGVPTRLGKSVSPEELVEKHNVLGRIAEKD